MPPSLISDDLLRQLIAVGQVDVVVGLPTHNNAASVAGVVSAIHQGLTRHFPRERTTLINLDGGSTDGTPEAVSAASSEDGGAVTARQQLRTAHRVSAPYHGVPGKGAGLRTLFAAADLLQAKAVAVLAPDVVTVTPEWIASLVRPVIRGEAEFVTPVFSRHPFDAPLVTQLVRPFMRAVYGRLIREPLAVEFACSPRFATHCLGQPVWESELGQSGIDLWLTAAALAEGFSIAQPVLGARVQAVGAVRPGLPDIVQQVVGALFSCLEIHQSFWLARAEACGECRVPSGDVPPAATQAVDVERLIETFERDVRSLLPVLERLVSAHTLEALSALVHASVADFRYSDELWVATVVEFAASHHHGAMHRQHVMQALVPLYLGRVASFFMEMGALDATLVDSRLLALCRQYEAGRPALVERWNHAG